MTSSSIVLPEGRNKGYRLKVTTHYLWLTHIALWYSWEATAYNLVGKGRTRTYKQAHAQGRQALFELQQVLLERLTK